MLDFSSGTMIWLALCVLFVISEAITANMVSIWFGIGALAALFTSSITNSAFIQWTVFTTVSFLTLVFTRPFVKAISKKTKVATNSDINIGKIATVISTVSPSQDGRVRLNDVDWIARSTYTIPEGESCIVQAVESAALIVVPQNTPVIASKEYTKIS